MGKFLRSTDICCEKGEGGKGFGLIQTFTDGGWGSGGRVEKGEIEKVTALKAASEEVEDD